MPRNISFSLTTGQIRRRKKTVTRRIGWAFIKPGDVLTACAKVMGLKKGERIEKLAMIRVVSVTLQPLQALLYDRDYGNEEAKAEGFPYLSGAEFVQMFCKHMKCGIDQVVTRIEFEYI